MEIMEKYDRTKFCMFSLNSISYFPSHCANIRSKYATNLIYKKTPMAPCVWCMVKYPTSLLHHFISEVLSGNLLG